MPSIQFRSLYLAAASLVALALSVEGNSSSQNVNKPTSNGGGGGGSCYDSKGNPITCPPSKKESIVPGVIAGFVVLVIIASIICCVVRKKRQRRLASNENDTMGADQQVPTEGLNLHEQAIPHSAHMIAEDELPLHPTPYDPPSPTQQDGHQVSDSASIASSDYNLSPVTPAQPQDYSYQSHDNTYLTAPPRTYGPHRTTPALTDDTSPTAQSSRGR